MGSRNRRFGLLAVVLGMVVPLATLASPSNKWRIQCSGGAGSNGTIVLSLAPVDATPVEVSVDIPQGTSENAVARHIRDALRAQLGEGYKVEVDDGEDVLVKRRSGQPDFDLSVTGNSVQGVRISLDKE